MPSVRGPSPKAPASAPASLVRIGRIAGTHGLKGALRFRPDDPDSTTLETLPRVHLETAGETREYRVLSAARAGGGQYRIVLEGIDTIEQAQALKGSVLMVAASELPALKPGEFFHFQVLGMEVRTADGRIIGRIADVLATGANDVWVVRGEREVLVPVIADVVKAIDLDAGVATIDAIAGLLE